MLLNWNRADSRSVEEIAVILKNRPDAPKLLARVQAGNRGTISRDQLFAWVTDPYDIIGLNIEQIGQRIGWDEDYIRYVLKKNNGKIWIDFIEPPANIKLQKVEWKTLEDETLDIISKGKDSGNDAYDDFLDAIDQIKPLLDKDGLIETNMIQKYFEILSNTKVEDISKLSQDVQKFRKRTEALFGNNPLFTGKGYTINNSFEIGTAEYGLLKSESMFNTEKMIKEGYKIKRMELSMDGFIKILE